jgi:hypothetical protein
MIPQTIDKKPLLIVPPLQSDVPFVVAIERNEKAETVVVGQEVMAEERPELTRRMRHAVVVTETSKDLIARTWDQMFERGMQA